MISANSEQDATEQTTAEKATVANCSSSWKARLAIVGALCLTVVGVLQIQFGLISKVALMLMGPPQVAMKETFANTTTTVPFDHSVLDSLLKKHVDSAGWIDYAGVRADESELVAYLQSVADADLNALGRDDRLAFLINAYNAFTLKLIIEHQNIKSIKDIPSDQRWDAVHWNLAGTTVSLSGIEHELIRPNFREPRIHFALVCAAIGCPPLRNEAYSGERLEDQLQRQTTFVHAYSTWFHYNSNSGTLHLTQLYNWYGNDFVQAKGSLMKALAENSPALKQDIAAGKTPRIEWLDYDWTLNDISNISER